MAHNQPFSTLAFYNDSISPVTKMRQRLCDGNVRFTMTQFLRLLKLSLKKIILSGQFYNDSISPVTKIRRYTLVSPLSFYNDSISPVTKMAFHISERVSKFYNDSISPVTKILHSVYSFSARFTMTQFLRLLK